MKAQALIGMAVSVLLAGCASTSGARKEPTTGTTAVSAHEPGMGMGMMDGMCPMQVPGTTVTSADLEDGVALVFATSTGDVAELRRRVQRMAEMHNRYHAAGEMMMGDQGPGGAGAEKEHGAGAAPGHEGRDRGGMMMGGGMMMPAATAAVEDIEGGARLVLRPKDPAQLEALREHARMMAGRMARGECPMMSPGADDRRPRRSSKRSASTLACGQGEWSAAGAR
jgi:hypothetical protein